LATQGDAVVIPSEAVQVGQEGQHVFVVKEDKRVEVRPVTIGQTNEGEAIIAKGLAAGEQVVREGQFLLGPGSRIEVKDPSKIAEDSKGEGRRGRGRAKAEGEVKEAARAAEETKGEGKRGRRGEGGAKAEGEAKGKADKRGES
jgi:hypothetical protein